MGENRSFPGRSPWATGVSLRRVGAKIRSGVDFARNALAPDLNSKTLEINALPTQKGYLKQAHLPLLRRSNTSRPAPVLAS